jgi:hypothetical protein
MARDNAGSMIPGFSLSVGGDALTRLLKLVERKPLPHVSLHMADENTATLFIDGVRASSGPVREAANKIRELGYRAGDEFQMHHPNGEQLMVRMRTPEERASGVSAIARRISKESEV